MLGHINPVACAANSFPSFRKIGIYGVEWVTANAMGLFGIYLHQGCCTRSMKIFTRRYDTEMVGIYAIAYSTKMVQVHAFRNLSYLAFPCKTVGPNRLAVIIRPVTLSFIAPTLPKVARTERGINFRSRPVKIYLFPEPDLISVHGPILTNFCNSISSASRSFLNSSLSIPLSAATTMRCSDAASYAVWCAWFLSLIASTSM